MATRDEGKTQGIRDILRKTKRPMNIKQLRRPLEIRCKCIINKTKLYQILAGMQTDGELDSVGTKDAKFWWFRKGWGTA